MMSVAFDYVSV